MGDGAQGTTPVRRRPSWVKWVNRGAIAAILVASAIVLFAVRPMMCKDMIAGTRVVRICEPVGATSAPAMLVLLVVVLLLLPEVTEISIVGLVGLKRQVTQTQAELASVKTEHQQTLVELASVKTEHEQTLAKVHDLGKDVSTIREVMPNLAARAPGGDGSDPAA